MAKKGATNSGGGAGRQRAKDQSMASNLPPSPATWNSRPEHWPYHNNLGARNRRKKAG
jgi:hypothetical protein